MTQTDQHWDKLLGIKTCGRVDFASDHFKYPYEPTPYCVLELLANTGLITSSNTVLDYGCGKGRVSFFLSHQTGCASLGVECNPLTLEGAWENLDRWGRSRSRCSVDFVDANAEAYAVPPQVDRCFFFNPFSSKTLQKVLNRIIDSYWEHPRRIILICYYPSNDFLSCLAAHPQLTPLPDIDCSHLFSGKNPRGRLALYETTPCQ